jgi:hypothetical protein
MGVQEIKDNLERANENTGNALDALGRVAGQAEELQNTSDVLTGKAGAIGSLVGQITGLLGEIQEDISQIRGGSVAIGTMIETLPATEVEAIRNAHARIDTDTDIVSRNYIDPAREKAQEGVGAQTIIENQRGGLVIPQVGKSAMQLLRSAKDLTQRAINKL